MKNLDSYILMFYHFKISWTPTDFTKRIKIYNLPRTNEQPLQKQTIYAMKINKRLYNIHSKKMHENKIILKYGKMSIDI